MCLIPPFPWVLDPALQLAEIPKPRKKVEFVGKDNFEQKIINPKHAIDK